MKSWHQRRAKDPDWGRDPPNQSPRSCDVTERTKVFFLFLWFCFVFTQRNPFQSHSRHRRLFRATPVFAFRRFFSSKVAASNICILKVFFCRWLTLHFDFFPFGPSNGLTSFGCYVRRRTMMADRRWPSRRNTAPCWLLETGRKPCAEKRNVGPRAHPAPLRRDTT